MKITKENLENGLALAELMMDFFTDELKNFNKIKKREGLLKESKSKSKTLNSLKTKRKTCTKCGIRADSLEEKLEIFGFMEASKDKLQSQCKKCRAEASKIATKKKNKKYKLITKGLNSKELQICEKLKNETKTLKELSEQLNVTFQTIKNRINSINKKKDIIFKNKNNKYKLFY